MKKIMFLIVLLSFALLNSCSNDTEIPVVVNPDEKTSDVKNREISTEIGEIVSSLESVNNSLDEVLHSAVTLTKTLAMDSVRKTLTDATGTKIILSGVTDVVVYGSKRTNRSDLTLTSSKFNGTYTVVEVVTTKSEDGKITTSSTKTINTSLVSSTGIDFKYVDATIVLHSIFESATSTLSGSITYQLPFTANSGEYSGLFTGMIDLSTTVTPTFSGSIKNLEEEVASIEVTGEETTLIVGNESTVIVVVKADTTKPEETYEALPTGYVVIDNFDNELRFAYDRKTNDNNQSDLGALFDYTNTSEDGTVYRGGTWFVYNDTSWGGDGEGNTSTYATPDYVKDIFLESGFKEDGPEGSGKCFSIDVTMGDYSSVPGYGFGCGLSGWMVDIDLTNLTKIAFDAKGSGTWLIKLKSKIAAEDYSDDWGDLQVDFELEPEWKNYSIDPSTLQASPHSILADGGVTWDDAKTAIRLFEIHSGTALSAGDKVSISIDNIRFYGMEATDFEWDDYTVMDK